MISFLLAAGLFNGLSNEDYTIRERADTELRRLIDGWPATYGPLVKIFAEKTESPEARSRSRRILNRYRSYMADSYRPRTVPIWPQCDCYPMVGEAGDERDRNHLLRLLRVAEKEPQLVGFDGEERKNPVWYQYRRATELMVREMIAEGTDAAEIDELLARMWAIERRDKHDCHRDWIGGDEWRAYPRIDMFSDSVIPPIEEPYGIP